jgi:hypothetical protein
LPLASNLGGTPGEHSPHEFGYFWQFHLEPREHDRVEENGRGRRRLNSIARELDALAGLHRSGVVLKNLNYVDLNIGVLARALPTAEFLLIERDPRFVAQSILLARRQRYGDERTWLSVRFPGHELLLDLDPIEQVVAQIQTVSTAIEAGLSELPSERYRRITYEDLVAEPVPWLRTVSDHLGAEPVDLEQLGTKALGSSNVVRLQPARFDRLSRLLENPESGP